MIITGLIFVLLLVIVCNVQAFHLQNKVTNSQRPLKLQMAAADTKFRRRTIVRSLETTTDKAAFEKDFYGNSELEDFIKNSSARLHTTLRRKIYKKARTLGITPKAEFAMKPFMKKPAATE